MKALCVYILEDKAEGLISLDYCDMNYFISLIPFQEIEHNKIKQLLLNILTQTIVRCLNSHLNIKLNNYPDNFAELICQIKHASGRKKNIKFDIKTEDSDGII